MLKRQCSNFSGLLGMLLCCKAGHVWVDWELVMLVEYQPPLFWQSLFIFSLDRIEQGFTSPPTQYRLYGRRFSQVTDPTNSIKVLKEQIVHKQIKHTISRHKHNTACPLVYNNIGWPGTAPTEGVPRRQSHRRSGLANLPSVGAIP